MDDIFGALEKGEDVMTLAEHPRAKAGVQTEGNKFDMFNFFPVLTKGEDAMTLVRPKPKAGVQAEGMR